MGFFKFLKREKGKEDLNELDLPPAPPSMEGFDQNMDLDVSDLTSSKQAPMGYKEDMHSSNIEKEDDFPEFDDVLEDEPLSPIPPISADTDIALKKHSQSDKMPSLNEEGPFPKIKGLFSKKGDDLGQMPAQQISHEDLHKEEVISEGKTIYINLEHFRQALVSINGIRSDLRKSDESIAILHNMKNSKDKSFDKIKSGISDLQKKLIFIDKTLYKGG